MRRPPPRTRLKGVKDHPTGPCTDGVYRSEGETAKTKKSNHKTLSLNKSLQTHTPKLSNVAILDDDASVLAITNSPIFSAECVAGPGHVREPDLGPISGPRRQPEVVGENMMRKRQMRHNYVNLMAKAASSDPTSKGTPAGPSRRTSPDTAHAPAEPHMAEMGSSPQNGGQQPDDTYGPTYHIARRGNKLVDWQFIGKKSIWFLRDSNLNRVPAHHSSDVQIDSFPGLTFYHLWQILGRTPAHPHVKILVLSAGINNKDQDPYKTSTKQLRHIYNRARSVFPNASIPIPQLKFLYIPLSGAAVEPDGY